MCIAFIAACSSGHPRSESTQSTTMRSGTDTNAPSKERPTANSPSVPTDSSHSQVEPIPTPAVTPPAQSAVDAYVAMGNVLDTWGVAPAKAKSAELAPYVTAAVLKQTVAVYASMAKQGLAYRGTPDALNLKVTAATAQSVVLSSCPSPDPSDPYVQYVLATGKPVAAPVSSVFHPKAITILDSSGHWRVASIIPDEGRTCSA
jgi:hypothetical protein